MGFFISQNLYCFNRQAIIPMTSFSLSNMMIYTNDKEGSQQSVF